MILIFLTVVVVLVMTGIALALIIIMTSQFTIRITLSVTRKVTIIAISAKNNISTKANQDQATNNQTAIDSQIFKQQAIVA